jgi:DNA-directed RNA polymerase specialized sigma24 family protein
MKTSDRVDGVSDDELVRRLTIGSHAALAELSTRWRERVIRFLASETDFDLDFDQLAQLAFEKVVRYAPSYQARGQFKGWIFRIAKNLLLDEIKRYGRERSRLGRYYTDRNPASIGTQASNACARKSYSDAFGADGASDAYDDGGDVLDVSYHTRGVDVSLRFSPRELEESGYDVWKEIKRMFSRFGLVDGPTPGIWKKSYKNMKINDSGSAFGGVIAGDTRFPNGSSPVKCAQYNITETCCMCGLRTKCSKCGPEFVCRKCELQASRNWRLAKQLAIISAH